jgi:membrane-associated protein
MRDFILACIHLNPLAIVQTGSYLGIAFIIFAESGLFIGVFFPGDSLLFIAGLLSASGILAPIPLAAGVVGAAILGDCAGYWFGERVGENLYHRKDSRFFKQAYLTRTQHFFEIYGARAIMLARFMPVVRTIAPILAGAGSMKYEKFMLYNVIGGFGWGCGMIFLGYFLGSVIPDIDKYILPLTLGIIAISFFPVIANVVRERRTR